jgi:hypothetical protein
MGSFSVGEYCDGVGFARMDEREQVVSLLDRAGVLAAIRWAHRSAYGDVWREYNPQGGHDQGWVGITAHKFMIDRQNRAFQLAEFAVRPGEGHVGRDVLADGILDSDFQSMPVIEPGAVVRADLNQSPGWMHGDWRWLMASFPYGRIDRIRWTQRSMTKKVVARQPSSGDDDGLFSLADIPGFPPLDSLEEAERLLRHTFVLAHAMDLETGETQVFLGRSRWNSDKGNPWVWKHDLSVPPSSAVRMSMDAVPDDTDVPDAQRQRPRAIGDA